MMKKLLKLRPLNLKSYLAVLGLLILWCSCSTVSGQEKPPRPISVLTAQNLSFGAFFHGVTGGTVIIDYDGIRSTTGDIILANLGYTFFPMIVEVDAEPGYLVHIMNGPDVSLSGSNGGSMILHLGDASTGNMFICTAIPPGKTEVRIGGTLTVGNPGANPAGSYSGSFQVTFIQE
jgi:hypothetical protein